MKPILQGRSVVITGGGRGIGAAAAFELAAAGAAVAVAARNEAQVVDVAAKLRERGYEAFAYRCDVAEPRQVRDLALWAAEAMGQVDILVNNAGTATSNPLSRVTIKEWNHIMAVNATGTFLCTQAMAPGMKSRGWGRIINVASIAGLEGGKYVSAYTAAKHAVVGFTRSIAAELDGTGVTVNAVCPGYVDTPLTDETIARIMRRAGKSWDAAREAVLKSSGQSRLIRASEVADAILDLCAEHASDVNGRMVILDGRDE